MLSVEGDIVTVDQDIAELRREEKPSEHGAVEAGQDDLTLSSNNSETHIQEKAEAVTASVTAAPPTTITSEPGSKERDVSADNLHLL